LAIRGQNLTSLAGEFEVDFETEPLASAGIFAITGPTGAGKSTLLDAVCLALFNHVPRLQSAARGQVGAAGSETLSADDPRALLRHRAGEGFAEVDFIGLDRGRYRARWYVKRARLRADGALQQVVQSFTNLDTGEVYGGTRTETLLAIKAKIGLTAQQFGRAVMLAQGEFNAFIDADSNTRAELLEKLTGTDLYARLGMAAREKADLLRGGLNEIEMRIFAQNGLDDIQRAETEAHLAKATGEHEAARALVTALERDRNWYARATELAGRVEQAEGTRAAAALRNSEAEPRRQNLALRRLAYSIVPAWQARIDADAKVAATTLRIFDLSVEADAKRALAEVAATVDAEAAETLRLAELDRERERPMLEVARALDRRLAELGETLGPLADARSVAAGDFDASAARHTAAVSRRDEESERRRTLLAWLDLHRSRESLSARRDDLAADIAEYGELDATSAALRSALDDVARRGSEARVSLTAAQQAATIAREAFETAASVTETARAAVPASGVAAEVERERDLLMAIEPCVLAFERADSDFGRLGETVEIDRVEHELLSEQLTASEVRRAEIEGALPALDARHGEAMRAGALSSAASGDAAERLRSTLVAGEPCPVCGGTDHAIEALAGLIDGRAAADADRIAELAGEIAALGRERAVLVDRNKHDDTRRAAIAARIEGSASVIAQARVRRAEALTTLEVALSDCGITGDLGPQSIRDEVSALLRTVEERRRRFSAARDAALLAGSVLDAARTAATRAGDAERLAEWTVRDLEAEHTVTSGRLAEAVRRRDHVATSLDTSLTAHFDWREDAGAIETLNGFVTAWRERADGLTQADGELPGLTSAAHDAEIELGQKANRLESAIQAESTCKVERDRLAAERAGMLGGEAADVVAGRLAAAVEAALTVREAARLGCENSRSDATAAHARHDQAVRSLAVDQTDATVRREILEGELINKGVDADLVSSVAAGGEAVLEEEALALAEIDRAVVAADAEWRSRVDDRDAHAELQTPAVPLDDLEPALGEATAAEATARAALSEAQFLIRQDDRAREATAALRATLEQERAAASPWLQLDVLIGDATGNKFRKYAQGLTLERLLLHANARLGELKPRYSLERAPGGDMLVQVVDHDMAGEIRGLPNLSGGERFLVSLALALGLSEMSTGQGLRVESLFIDEGFGALDSASLGQAIGVLEQLHATGRRVGVISHIEDVKERIAVKIAVSPASNGRSSIEVQGG
jgi:exonuclease SbcC